MLLGIIIAALIGVGAAFAMQSMMPETVDKTTDLDSTAQIVDPLRMELARTEQKINGKIEELSIALETMNARITDLQKEMQSMPVQVAGTAPDGTPVPSGNMIL